MPERGPRRDPMERMQQQFPEDDYDAREYLEDVMPNDDMPSSALDEVVRKVDLLGKLALANILLTAAVIAVLFIFV